MPKVPYSYEVNGKSVTRNGSLIQISSLSNSSLMPCLTVQYMNIPSSNLCTEIVSDIQNNFCTQHALPMFCKKESFWKRFTCTSVCKQLSRNTTNQNGGKFLTTDALAIWSPFMWFFCNFDTCKGVSKISKI